MFVTLAVFGACASILAFCYKETLETRYTGSLVRSWTRLGVVIRNPRFVILLCIFSIAPMALMGFLAAGSYIYINGRGLIEQQFSYFFFSFNAIVASFGPTIYMKLFPSHCSAERYLWVLCSVGRGRCNDTDLW